MSGTEAGLYDDFPIDPYYRDHILSARTLMRSGRWWRAAVLIRNPRTGVSFLQLYLWESKEGQWKRRSSYAIRKRALAKALADYLNEILNDIEDEE